MYAQFLKREALLEGSFHCALFCISLSSFSRREKFLLSVTTDFCDALPQQQYQNGESEENHEQFLKALQNAVTTFLNRMKSNHMRGRSITNDSAVLSLFQSINNMHPQLLELLNQLDEKRRESTLLRLMPFLFYVVLSWRP